MIVDKMVLLFFGLQLVNVMLSTAKSIITVKGDKKLSCVVNAVSYTFYACIVKMITTQDMMIVGVVTFITNIIGVYLITFILEKLRKDRLWRISVTIKSKEVLKEITEGLGNYNIKFLEVDSERYHLIDIFSYTSAESTLIKEVLKNKKIKYTIQEIERRL